MRQIAVISGKGGTGKSSISAAFATLNNEVVIADCDVDAANLYLLFSPSDEEEHVYIAGYKALIDYTLCSGCGLCAGHCRFDAISYQNNRVIIDEVSCDGCFLCSRICPEKAIRMIPNDQSKLYSGSFRNGRIVYGRLAPGEENSGKLVNMVREKARQVAEKYYLEIIILDGPPGIGCPAISTITGVDQVIIVTEPTISGLHDLGRAAEIVIKSGRKPSVIINKWNLNPAVADQIRCWCGNHNLKVEGELPFDKKMVSAMVQCKTIAEFDKENEITRELNRIWNNILNSN
ncbi:MAG TPA: ATP-binding protein [Bacteroidales bacterium]|nr:ATP-binding protein [Bacteroidales bacterium]